MQDMAAAGLFAAVDHHVHSFHLYAGSFKLFSKDI